MMRDRIAQAIRAGIYRSDDDATDDQTWLACADAVIAELRMRAETRIGPGEPGEGLSQFIRYVTEWGVDE